MSPIDTTTILQRIEQLLASEPPAGDMAGFYKVVNEVLQGTITVGSAVYGADSLQVQTLIKTAEAAPNSSAAMCRMAWPGLQGTLRAMKADVEAGLVGSVQRRAVGEVIADMLGLAKKALEEGSDGAKNVAAVLVAASYEDTVRKMGSMLAGVTGQPGLQDVLVALKGAKVLEGASYSNAHSYLTFRNKALHAHWDQVDGVVVGSCLVWVEGTLEKHFS